VTTDPGRRRALRGRAAERAHGSSEAVGEFTDGLYPLCEGPVEFERFEPIADAGS
jgi:hypothetical protein